MVRAGLELITMIDCVAGELVGDDRPTKRLRTRPY